MGKDKHIFNMILGYHAKIIDGKAYVKQHHRLVGTFDLSEYEVRTLKGAIIIERSSKE